MTRTYQWTTFDALRDRNFRWLWVGRLASSATFQMGTIAQGWLVYEITGSAFALGWVGAGWSISTLVLSLYGGAVADRVEKRDLLIWTRLAMAINTLAIAFLASTDLIQIWHLVINSLLTGVLFAFMMPADQALLSELVGSETLLNAMSLNSVGMGLMGIFCASLAGYLVQAVGVEGAYFTMGGFYLVALFCLTHLPTTGQGDETGTSVWADLREGVSYIWQRPILLALLGLALARVLFAMPYRTFMPKFAQDVMGMDASGLGILMAAPGLGGLVSSLGVASLGDFRGKGRLLLAAGVVVGVSLMLFGSSSSLAYVLLFLGVVGAANNACMVANNTLIQVNCETRLRGRVMSVYMMMWGLTPLGTMPAGIIADRLGVSSVIALQGGVLILIFLGIALLWPHIRWLE
jgi:MFS family permease